MIVISGVLIGALVGLTVRARQHPESAPPTTPVAHVESAPPRTRARAVPGDQHEHETRMAYERDDDSPRSTPAAPTTLRFIAAGGGPSPDENQVSVEDDLALLDDVLGKDHGLVLFAGGAGTRAVQILDSERRGDGLLQDLSDFFDARDGRDSHYRPTRLAVHAPATRRAILAALDGELAGAASTPLLLFLGGHGAAGETPSESTLLTWGEEAMAPADLGSALDRAHGNRRVQVVVTSCYSGGFADLLYREGDPQKGPSPLDRCGFFSTTWDLQASGGDPNPDRGAQEGYAVHVLHALRGEDRDGAPLPREAIDLDGDGQISLLEAHARAATVGTSLDVPNTTSEAWLRAVAPKNGPSSPVALPETDAIAHAMARRVGLLGHEERARGVLAERHAEAEALESEVLVLEDAETDAFQIAAAALLSRWPVLDDPWHPDFAETLAREHDAITHFFETSPEIAAWREAEQRQSDAELRLDDLWVQTAPYERLVRALDDRTLAARLHVRGGPQWSEYQKLLACERGVP